MYKSKIAIIIFFFTIPLFQYGQYTDQINSNRPGETMSAFSVGKSIIQVEAGVYGIKENHSVLNYDANGFGFDMTLRYGLLLEKLELIADIQYQYQFLNPAIIYPQKSAFKQTIFGAKYLIYDPFKNYEKKVNLYSWKANQKFNWRQFIPAVSIFAGTNIIFKNNPYYFSDDSDVSSKMILIAQNHLGDKSWVLVTNIIADYIDTKYPSYGYVITLTKGFNKKWSGFVENQGFKSDFYSDALVRGGFAHLIHDDMQFDVSISKSLKTTPALTYGGIGFSWRYDQNYQATKLDKKKNKNISNKKKDSKKEKKKK
jgi:hypothetical protein